MDLDVIVERSVLTFHDDGDVSEGPITKLFDDVIGFDEISLDYFGDRIFHLFVDFSGSDESFVRLMDKFGHFQYMVERDVAYESYYVYDMYIPKVPRFSFETLGKFDR